MDLKLPLFLTAAGTLLLLAAGPAAAASQQNARQEIATAAAHAGMAANAADLTMVHAHLHHVINCLVGPHGAAYDATQEDPCKGQGAGAIPDTTSAGTKKNLEAALAIARTGARDTSMTTAKEKAEQVQSRLTSALGK